jgi:ABC-type uncharacterized transport system involved in gliding motility auxiliary subunit
MHLNQKLRFQLLAQNFMFVLLLLAAVALAAYLALDSRKQWDITQNTLHTLSEASRNTLKQLPGEVLITAYATKEDPRLGDVRKLISDFVALYQRVKPDIRLKFVDPVEQPKATREASIQANGEMVISYQGRSEHLTTLNEQALTNLLMRLARNHERLVMFLDGHGERSLIGVANHDLGDFGKQLQLKGFKLNSLNLAIAQDVPKNMSLLVITQPQVDLIAGEVAKLKRYVDSGGNLLWLIDPEPLHGLQPLAELLGLTLTPGTVIDPAAQQLNVPPTWALGASYGIHPVLRNFNLTTVFPFARQIAYNESSEWRITPLVEAAQRGWVESGSLENNLAFDQKRDIPGPVTIAAAFERQVEDRVQRVGVVGSGSFLANTYLGNGGNLDLGVNLVNWLAGDENLITVQPRAAIDSSLSLSKLSAGLISVGFLIVLPLLFIATAGFIWWRRRKL